MSRSLTRLWLAENPANPGPDAVQGSNNGTVEAMGLEPTTSTLQRSHSSQLSYAPVCDGKCAMRVAHATSGQTAVRGRGPTDRRHTVSLR